MTPTLATPLGTGKAEGIIIIIIIIIITTTMFMVLSSDVHPVHMMNAN